MSNCLKALAFSLITHGLAAVALAFWLSHTQAIELPSLDLSAVELSFAEEEREAPVVPPPPPEPEPTPPPPEPEPKPEPPPPEPEPAPILPRDDPISRKPQPKPAPPPPEPAPPPPQPEPELPPPPLEPPPPPQPDEPTNQRINEPTNKRINEPTPASAPQAPKQARIDAQPRLQKTIQPKYPDAARKRGAEGEVTLELEISEKGRVSAVRLVESCGHADLDEAAERAARTARFIPAKAGRNAVASVARITISFRLTKR